MTRGMQFFQSRGTTRALAGFFVLALAFQALPAVAAQGDTVTTGTPSGVTVPGGFRFEPEVPFTSLKNVPTWSEIEQLLDNPYIVTHDATTPGNDNGFPSYRATGMTRRPGFGVTLPSLLVHPLNYNPTTGEEMRLLNPGYPGGTFDVVDQLVRCDDPVLGPSTPGCDGTVTAPGPAGPVTTGPFSADRYVWRYASRPISPGADRVEPGEAAIDYNSPVEADAYACVVSTELVPPEGATLCGFDPGEPGNPTFGVRNLTGYSVPAIQLPAGSTTGTVIPTTARLFDPARGVIQPRNPGTGAGGLRKPSLRVPEAGGTPNNPNYLVNAGLDPLADATTPSNENDYVRSATVARALGKALFWDMQVGSDGVQSCGTCHFNGTGTDTRTKNQLNPNHIGGDNTLQIGDTDLDPAIGLGKAANYVLKASDFPLHNVANPDVAGDPACTTPRTANTTAIPYAAATAGLTGGPYLASQAFSNPVSDAAFPVCDAANIVSDVNDVVSSMGVHFGRFKDIAPIGSFVGSGVLAVAPDLRGTPADCCGGDAACVACSSDSACRVTLSPPILACLNLLSDPIPAFGGVTDPVTGLANQFRRVEPRNTPTMQAAGFNFDNFWDGRARHDFNGGSVFGAADPQSHVWVASPASALAATRQIIRFVSIASLATGPGLSEFEMSFQGRNWAKIGKKLLQGTVVNVGGSPTVVGTVTPLANQLVDPTDSLLGVYSNQGGSLCAGLAPSDRSPGSPAPGRPGLCISYPGLIRQAFYPALWRNVSGMHLVGCYTDGNAILHPNQCGTGSYPAADVQVLENGAVVGHNNDPFDGYVLTAAAGAVDAADTNQFRQMEGNFSLFWGLAVQSWVNVLVPDNTPFDQFLDINPGAFSALGEPGEPGLVPDQLNCGQPGADPNYCFRPFGNFKRDPGVKALQNPTGEGGAGGTLVVSGGDRGANDPDPLLGLDLFFASNLSLKNPNFRTGRCGECHAIPTLTDHTMPFTSKINLMDAVAEFSSPGVELVVEPLARLRVISGFLLESEINENGQDAVERRIVDQSIVPNTVDGLAYPGATEAGLPWFPAAVYGNWTGADQAFLDNGIYNLGIRPIAEDLGRGGNDAFGWPLSIAALMMKNLAGPGFNPGGDDATNGYAQPAAPGIAMETFDPEAECFGLFEPTAQDQQINPGCDGEPANPLIPPYLGAFVNNITVGDFPPELDEAGGAIGGMVNTLTDAAMIEGFMDSLGPFNPANVFAEVMNFGGFSNRPGDVSAMMGTWPNVNRVGRMGSFKAAPLRNVELTGPYFHNGGKLTLRQVVDFYNRGGDFPITNSAHRDFNLVNQNIEIQSNMSEAEKVALVDFLLELTDERNRFDRAPFDHPEVIVPVDGLAPDNTLGRGALLANPMFRSVSAVGAAGMATPEPAFLNVTKVRLSGAAAARPTPGHPNPECDYDGAAGTGRVSHYCH
jgi:cytochrome c peroxidase